VAHLRSHLDADVDYLHCRRQRMGNRYHSVGNPEHTDASEPSVSDLVFVRMGLPDLTAVASSGLGRRIQSRQLGAIIGTPGVLPHTA